ncbi:glucokinase [Tropicibacter naphthalenivorans]|nr:glucokinase [Tropicibacter naphthalenivorans]
MTDLHIVADIGGTNTRVALCQGARVLTDTIRRYRNAEHPGIAPILRDFLAHTPGNPRAICIDLAGPVHDGIGTLTNLDWIVDARALAAEFGADVVELLNDMQAQGHAVPYFKADALTPILPGQEASPGAARLVVNVGTGLNIAPVYSVGAKTVVPAAEAGHISLQAKDDEELRLLTWIAAKHPSPGVEDILSGRGLERLHAFVCDDEGTGTPLDAAGIMAAFLEGDAQCARAARLFVRFLGRYTGDLSLITLPFGGIYLVGGVARHLGPHLLRLGFAESLADKGRFAPYVTQFPVHLVTDDYAALAGCAGHLSEVFAPE